MAFFNLKYRTYSTKQGWSTHTIYATSKELLVEPDADMLFYKYADNWALVVENICLSGKAKDLGIDSTKFFDIPIKQAKKIVLDYLNTPKKFKVIYKGTNRQLIFYPPFDLAYRAISTKRDVKLFYRDLELQHRSSNSPRALRNLVFKFPDDDKWSKVDKEFMLLFEDSELFDKYCNGGCLLVRHAAWIGSKYLLFKNKRGAFAIHKNHPQTSKDLEIFEIEELGFDMVGIDGKVFQAGPDYLHTSYAGIDRLFGNIFIQWSQVELVSQVDF